MLSITAVPQDHLYQGKERKQSNLPKLKNTTVASPRTKIEHQKIFSDLNHEAIHKNLQATKHSNQTQIQTIAFQKECEPKINQIARKTENSKRTLIKIDRALHQIENDDLNNLRQLTQNIETQNSFIIPKTQTEFKELDSNIQQHKQYIDWYISKYEKELSKHTENVNKLFEEANENELDSTSFFETSKAKLKLLNPKLKVLETHSTEIETKFQEFLQMNQKMIELMKQYKAANKDLKYLETDGVNEMVVESYQTLIQHINELTMNAEKDIHKSEMKLSELEQQVEINKTECEQEITTINQNSKQCQDNEVKISTLKHITKERIEDLVNKLHETVENVKTVIAEQKHETKYSNWKSALHAKRELQYAMKIARIRIEALDKDWTEFNQNNEQIQEELRQQISGINIRIGSSDQIMDRIDSVAAKLNWCQKRIMQWQRTDQLNKQKVQSLKSIEESEKRLLEIEQLLKKNDRAQPQLQPFVISPVQSRALPPEISEQTVQNQEINIQMPQYKLTYSANEIIQEDEIERDHFEEEEFTENDDDQSIYIFPDEQINKKSKKMSSSPIKEKFKQNEILVNESETSIKDPSEKEDDETEPETFDDQNNNEEEEKPMTFIQKSIALSLEDKNQEQETTEHKKRRKKKVHSSTKEKENIIEKVKTADGKIRVKKKVTKRRK